MFSRNTPFAFRNHNTSVSDRFRFGLLISPEPQYPLRIRRGSSLIAPLQQQTSSAPAAFAIGAGQATELLGVLQFTPDDESPFRYNFGFVETDGGQVTVRVHAINDQGTSIASKDYNLGPHGVMQRNISDVVPDIQTENLRVHIEVLSGDGRILAFGSGIATGSNDPSTFEMLFADELLGGGGSGDDLTSVAHDTTLTGDGTPAAPLGLADNSVTASKIASTNNAADGDSLTFTPGGSNVGAYGGGCANGIGVLGKSTTGVQGEGENGIGVNGIATGGKGVVGTNSNTGNYGELGLATAGVKAVGLDQTSSGLFAQSTGGDAVQGHAAASNRSGVYGTNSNGSGYGLYGRNTNNNNEGFVGGSGSGVWGRGTGASHGVIGDASRSGNAGQFFGSIQITGDLLVNGNLSKGGGTFRIDHPLDPENRILAHSFVESPEMMNVYNGMIILSDHGVAWVELPVYYEALNRDFLYQLTCVGGYAPVFIAEEIAENRFKIAGGVADLKVSWQVTGVRKDAWAESNRVVVETDKPLDQQGHYLHPEAFGLSPDWKFDN